VLDAAGLVNPLGSEAAVLIAGAELPALLAIAAAVRTHLAALPSLLALLIPTLLIAALLIPRFLPALLIAGLLTALLIPLLLAALLIALLQPLDLRAHSFDLRERLIRLRLPVAVLI